MTILGVHDLEQYVSFHFYHDIFPQHIVDVWQVFSMLSQLCHVSWGCACWFWLSPFLSAIHGSLMDALPSHPTQSQNEADVFARDLGARFLPVVDNWCLLKPAFLFASPECQVLNSTTRLVRLHWRRLWRQWRHETFRSISALNPTLACPSLQIMCLVHKSRLHIIAFVSRAFTDTTMTQHIQSTLCTESDSKLWTLWKPKTSAVPHRRHFITATLYGSANIQFGANTTQHPIYVQRPHFESRW